MAWAVLIALLQFHRRRRVARAMVAGATPSAYQEPRVTLSRSGPPQPKCRRPRRASTWPASRPRSTTRATRNTRALVIGRDGHIVFEKYWDDTTLDSPVDLSGFTPC